jgi:WD40 repeat protein
MRALAGHTGFVQALAFSPDGATLASAGADGTVRLWDVAAGCQRHELLGHEGWVSAVAWHPQPAANLVASAGHDGSVRLWDAATGGPRLAPTGHKGVLVALAFTPDGARLVWGGYQGCVGAWSIGQAGRGRWTRLQVRDEMIFAVRFAPDGSTLATAGSGPAVQLWEADSGQAGRLLEHGDRQGCRALAFSPDGSFLALALGSGVQVWAAGTGRLLAELADHADIVSAVAWGPTQAALLLTGSWDGTVRLYEVDGQGRVVRQRDSFDWGLGKVFDVAFAPDGMTAACAGERGERLVLWDVE